MGCHAEPSPSPDEQLLLHTPRLVLATLRPSPATRGGHQTPGSAVCAMVLHVQGRGAPASADRSRKDIRTGEADRSAGRPGPLCLATQHVPTASSQGWEAAVLSAKAQEEFRGTCGWTRGEGVISRPAGLSSLSGRAVSSLPLGQWPAGESPGRSF